MRTTFVVIVTAATSIALLVAISWLYGIPLPSSAIPHDPADSPVAASFDLTTVDGRTLSSRQLHGEVVVLDFWATWCGPCVTEIDDYNALLEEFGDVGLKVIGVTMESGSAEQVASFAADYGIAYPLAMGNEEVAALFGPLWGYPTTVLLDRDWKVRRSWMGAGRQKHRELRKAVEALVTEGS